MKLGWIITLALALLLLGGCSLQFWPEVKEEILGEEHIGGKYNLTLVETRITTEERSGVVKRIVYMRDGKLTDPDNILPDEMRPGLDWLKANTPEDAVVMSWWDYGNAIRAYSEREPVIDAASKEILTTTVSKYIGVDPKYIDCDSCVPHELIQDVATVLLTEDAEEALAIMDKHGASVLYVNREDRGKSYAFFVALEKEQGDISDSILGKALAGEEIPGFWLEFSDEVCRIYVVE